MTVLSAQLDISTPPVIHGFREPADLLDATDKDPLLMELIKTQAFQRLKDIRFLGAIDYRLIPWPNGKPGAIRYSRYEHSLGVMQLARLYCLRRDIRESERRLLCAAALLHDIGHPPLSHSVESVFKEKFGIDHHTASKDIICGRKPLGKNVFSILRRYGVDVEKLVAVVSGEVASFDGFFHGPINFDTIEGILRSYRYIRSTPSASSPDIVTDAAIKRENEKDKDIVDEFWKCKDLVYKKIINSENSVLYDFVCKIFLRKNLERIKYDSFFCTEAKLFQQLPGLKELLTSRLFKAEAIRMIDEPVCYVFRDYYIDREGDFFSRQDDVRYQHSRSKRILKLKMKIDSAAKAVTDSQGVLFYDDAV